MENSSTSLCSLPSWLQRPSRAIDWSHFSSTSSVIRLISPGRYEMGCKSEIDSTDRPNRRHRNQNKTIAKNPLDENSFGHASKTWVHINWTPPACGINNKLKLFNRAPARMNFPNERSYQFRNDCAGRYLSSHRHNKQNNYWDSCNKNNNNNQPACLIKWDVWKNNSKSHLARFD